MYCPFDNCRFILKKIKTPKRFWLGEGKPEVWRKLTWLPVYNNFTKKVAHYKIQNQNIYLKLYENHVVCNNSIHKFSIGCNFKNYTIEQFIKGIRKLNNLTNWNWFDADVIKLEAGINLRTEKAELFYSKFLTYKGKKYEELKPKNGFKVYGAICPFDEYDMIIYDKKFQLLHQERKYISYGLLRVELKIEDMSCIRNLNAPIKINQVKDMINPSIIKQIFQHIKSIIMSSIKKITRNFSKFSNAELRIIASFENKEIFKHIEAKCKRSADELRRKYHALMKA